MELPTLPSDCCKTSFFKKFSKSMEARRTAFVCEFCGVYQTVRLPKEWEEICAGKGKEICAGKEEEICAGKEEEICAGEEEICVGKDCAGEGEEICVGKDCAGEGEEICVGKDWAGVEEICVGKDCAGEEEICVGKDCAGEEEEICASKEEDEMYISGLYAKEDFDVVAEVGRSASCVVCKICIANGKGPWAPSGCKICIAKAAALNRIKAAGGDSAKAAEESAARAAADIYVVNAVLKKGVVTNTFKVPEAYIERLLAGPKLTPLLPLAKQFLQKNPQLRESILSTALEVLKDIERQEYILAQFFRKGYAELEVHPRN